VPQVDGELDLEDVAAWALRQTWLPVGYSEDDEEWQRREFSPPLLRFYRDNRPRELKAEAEKVAREAESQRRAEESRRAAQRAAEHRRRMRDMREWGPANGFFVGTRGRIPRRVVEAYNQAKGLE
jgi:hypothetical protein